MTIAASRSGARSALAALAALAAFAPAMGGCSSQPAPAMRVVDAHLVQMTEDGFVVLVTVEGHNKSDDPLPLRMVNYSVSIDGERVFQGIRSAECTLPRNGSHAIRLPAAAPIAALPSGAPGPGAEYEIRGTVEYETPGVLSDILFDAGVLRRTAGFSGSGELGQPRTPKR